MPRFWVSPEGSKLVLGLAALAALTGTVWLDLSLGFDAVSGDGPVLRFLIDVAALGLVYVLALAVARRADGEGRRRMALAVVALGAVAFRLVAAGAGLPREEPIAALLADLRGETMFQPFLLYDNDAWRYLWDGALVANGIDPYRWTPNEVDEESASHPELAGAAELLDDDHFWEVFENLSYRDYRSVYGPLAQGFFALSHLQAPGSIAAWKLLLVAGDLLACWLVYRWGRRRCAAVSALLLYGWNPLVIKEIAGSGHIDGLIVPLLLGAFLAATSARRRDALAMGLLGAACLVKPTVLVALVPLWNRVKARGLAVLALVAAAGWAPFASSLGAYLGALRRMGGEWRFNGGSFRLVEASAERFGSDGAAIATAVAAVWVAATAFWVWKRRQGVDGTETIGDAALLLGVVTLAAPVVNPWYLLPALACAAAAGSALLPVGFLAALLSYWRYAGDPLSPGLLWLEHLVLAGALAGWVLARPRLRR